MPYRRISHIAMLVLGTIFIIGCQSEDHDIRLEKEHRILQLDLSLALQSDGDMPETRAPGDPGTYEKFVFPEHAYIYLVAEKNDGTTTVCKRTNEKGDEQAGLQITLEETNWRKTIHTLTVPQTVGDSVYVYLDKLYFKIPSATTVARLYVAMSKQQFNNLSSITAETSTEGNVQSMTFDIPSSDAIQHIYSSPYNYEIDNRYYGTVTISSESARLSLMLYHVAAKVDMMWNVDKTLQATNRITYIQARKLKKKNCLLFKPTENTWTDADDASNYTFDLMDADVSRQWYGRQYYYTIPYQIGNKYPIYLHILKNGDNKDTYVNDGYNLTIKRTPTSAVFVPWLRGDLKFTNAIDYGNVEK